MALRAILCGFVLLAFLVPAAAATDVLDTVTSLVDQQAPVASPAAHLVKDAAAPLLTGASGSAQQPVAAAEETAQAPPTLFVDWQPRDDAPSASREPGSDQQRHDGLGLTSYTGLLYVPLSGVAGALPLIDGDGIGLPLFGDQSPAAAPPALAPAAPAAPAPAAQDAGVVQLPAAPVAPAIVAAAAAVTVAAPALAMPLWERLRKVGFLALLYTRIAKERLLDHASREKLLAEMTANPGLSVVELAARSGTPRNTATYHLRRMEKEGLAFSEARGRVRLWFPAGAGVGRAQAPAIAALRHDTTRAVAEGIGASPGIDQTTLCARLQLPPSLAHWHADRLVSAGLVRKERDGRRVRYYPGASFDLVARSA